MATLSTALSYALSGLTTAAAQSAVVSRNVANAGDADYTRKIGQVITLPGGASAVASYDRSADKRLLDKLLDTTSTAAGKQSLLTALQELSATVGDPESDASLGALMGKLQQSLQAYETNPSSAALGTDAIRAASAMASGLNGATDAIQQARAAADAGMKASVDTINSLLGQFKIANDTVVRGNGTALELTDALDQRDRILKQLSAEIGVRTVTRPNNDIAIYSDSGVTLFESNPRSLTMAATTSFAPGVAGQAVYADGVRITGLPSAMPVSSGKLQGLADFRDRLSVTYQNQVDEVARGLVTLFAEQDQSGGALPDQTGLFTWAGSPAVPPAGTLTPGIAASIRVNPLADTAQGGNPALLRDGGLNGAAYIYNSGGTAGYQQRLANLIGGFDLPQSFDPAAQNGSISSLKSYATESSGWLESNRQFAASAADYNDAMKTRANEALLRVTGVNIDEEMAAMLDLEKSYQASSKVLGVIDGLLGTLMDTIR